METQWQKKHNDIKRKGYPMFKNYNYSHHNNHVHLWFKPKRNWRWSWNGWKTHDDDFSLTASGCILTDFQTFMKYKGWMSAVGRRPHGGISTVGILITSLGCNASWEISASGISWEHCIDWICKQPSAQMWDYCVSRRSQHSLDQCRGCWSIIMLEYLIALLKGRSCFIYTTQVFFL